MGTATSHRAARGAARTSSLLAVVLALSSIAQPAVARPIAVDSARATEVSPTDGAGPTGLAVVHRPPPAAVYRRDLVLVVAHAHGCGAWCGRPNVAVEVVGADPGQRYLIQRVGGFAAGTMRVTIPGRLVIGDELRYRLTVTQQRCKPLAHRCTTARVITPWRDVPVIDGSRLPHAAPRGGPVPGPGSLVPSQGTPPVVSASLEELR